MLAVSPVHLDFLVSTSSSLFSAVLTQPLCQQHDQATAMVFVSRIFLPAGLQSVIKQFSSRGTLSRHVRQLAILLLLLSSIDEAGEAARSPQCGAALDMPPLEIRRGSNPTSPLEAAHTCLVQFLCHQPHGACKQHDLLKIRFSAKMRQFSPVA